MLPPIAFPDIIHRALNINSKLVLWTENQQTPSIAAFQSVFPVAMLSIFPKSSGTITSPD